MGTVAESEFLLKKPTGQERLKMGECDEWEAVRSNSVKPQPPSAESNRDK